MLTAADLLFGPSVAVEAIWDASAHPRAGAGDPTGGQFAIATTTASAKGGARRRVPAAKPAPKARTAAPATKAAFTGVLAYNPKTNTGPGYNSRKGDPNVHKLQLALTRLGCTDGRGRKLKNDGKLGPLTTQAVKQAQARLGLQPTGRVTAAFLTQLSALKSLPPLRAKASVTAAELLHGDSPAVAALEAWDPAKHPRIPKGQPGAGHFMPLLDRIEAAVSGWSMAHGNVGDPLKGFSRDQLRQAAKTQGQVVPRGATHDWLAQTVHRHILLGAVAAPPAKVVPTSPASGRHRPRAGTVPATTIIGRQVRAQVGAAPPSTPRTVTTNIPVRNALDVVHGAHPKSHTVTQRLKVYGALRASEFRTMNQHEQQTVLAHLQHIHATSKGGNKVRADQLIWRFTPAGTPVGAIPPQPVIVPKAAKAATVLAPTPGAPGLLKLAKDRGQPGDGWSRNPDGSPGPWGKYGAAGLMLSHVGTDGKRRYLMVQRGPAISDPGKWQFPGGAIDSKETAHEGATRETIEELGFGPGALDDALVHGEHVHSIPGGWRYTSIAATVPTQLTPDLSTHHARAETSDAKWMTAEEIDALDRKGKLLAPLAGGKLQRHVMTLFPAVHPTGAMPPPAAPTRHKKSRGIDLLATTAAKDQLRQDVKRERGKYDGKTADGRLAAIGAMQGYDDVPTVVSKKEMDRLLATGDYIEAWRGVRGAGSVALSGSGRGGGAVSRHKTAADIHEDMRSGPAYYGRGIFGNGYYLAESKSVAQGYADGSKDSVVRVLIPKDASVIDHSDALRGATLIASPHSKSKGKPYEEGTLFDEGRYAAAKGHAGIRIPHTSRSRTYASASHVATPRKAAWNWLDRSVLIVQEAQ